MLSVPGCEFTGFQNMNLGEAEVGTITQWRWRSAWWAIGWKSRSRPGWWGSSAPRLQVWAPAGVQTDGPLHQARSSLCTLEVFHRIGHPVACALDNLHVWNGFGYLGGNLNCRKMICLEHLQWRFLLLISSTHCDPVTRLVFGECFESWPVLLGGSLKFQRTASSGYMIFSNKSELVLSDMFWLVLSLGCSMYRAIWFEH